MIIVKIKKGDIFEVYPVGRSSENMVAIEDHCELNMRTQVKFVDTNGETHNIFTYEIGSYLGNLETLN